MTMTEKQHEAGTCYSCGSFIVENGEPCCLMPMSLPPDLKCLNCGGFTPADCCATPLTYQEFYLLPASKRQAHADRKADFFRPERTARRRQPTPVEPGDNDSWVAAWQFPRGMSDAAIRNEIARQGYEPEGYPCRCTDGDCCGAVGASSVFIEQNRNHKHASISFRRCI